MQKGVIYYYIGSRGENPVREFINSLDNISKAKIHHIFDMIKRYGLLSIINHIRKLSGLPLWEIRIIGKDNIRILYVKTNVDNITVLHGFIKKSRKTPFKEISIALNRYKRIQKLKNII